MQRTLGGRSRWLDPLDLEVRDRAADIVDPYPHPQPNGAAFRFDPAVPRRNLGIGVRILVGAHSEAFPAMAIAAASDELLDRAFNHLVAACVQCVPQPHVILVLVSNE